MQTRTTTLLYAAALLVGTRLADGQSLTPAVFVTNNVGDSVTSFTVLPDGTLNRVSVTPSGDGPQTVSLTPGGRFLAVANGTASTTTEELRIFAVNADATLSPRLTVLVSDSPLDAQWLNDEILTVTDTSAGGANSVQAFRYDSIMNSLTMVDTEPTGSFNTRLATTRTGGLLYANNTSGTDSIFAFSATAGGALTLIENEITDPVFAVDIAASRDGNFLYGASGISGGGNSILGFAIDGAGQLTPLAASPFVSSGVSPKVIALRGDDRVLVAGHGTDATFRTFLRDPVSGGLVATSNMFDVGLQGTLGDLQIMGDLLFVTDSSTATDGIAGLYSFRLNADGTFNQLGPILDTLGSRPEYIAPWVGVPDPAGGVLGMLLAWSILVRERPRRWIG
ncbi:MAG TPA: beta-propeller fold lactonase family protein [Pirellulaceae bacterium]